MTDIDQKLDAVESAMAKAYFSWSIPIPISFVICMYLYIFHSVELIETTPFAFSMIIILAFFMRQITGVLTNYFLSDEEKKFKEDWSDYQRSKINVRSSSRQDDFDEFLKNKE